MFDPSLHLPPVVTPTEASAVSDTDIAQMRSYIGIVNGGLSQGVREFSAPFGMSVNALSALKDYFLSFGWIVSNTTITKSDQRDGDYDVLAWKFDPKPASPTLSPAVPSQGFTHKNKHYLPE